MQTNATYWRPDSVSISRDTLCLWNVSGDVNYTLNFKYKKQKYAYYVASSIRPLTSLAEEWNLDKILLAKENGTNNIMVSSVAGYKNLLSLKCVLNSTSVNLFNPANNNQLLNILTNGVASINKVILFVNNSLVFKIYVNKKLAYSQTFFSDLNDPDCFILIETDLPVKNLNLIAMPRTIQINNVEQRIRL